MRNSVQQKRKLPGCLLALLLLIGCLILSCGILAETTTPLSTWLYFHNYYFQDVVNILHAHH